MTHMKRSGGSCLANGTKYERHILQLLSETAWNHHPIATPNKTGGATRLHDIVVVVNSRRVAFEVKSKNSFEGGGKTLRPANGTIKIPIGFLGSNKEHTCWEGKVPSFLNGDKSTETWKTEKTLFRAEYRPVSADAVRLYYKEKGTDYIQIQGKGLYHTGDDPLMLGVPAFQCPTRIRIRCKQHSSSTLPGSVQASLVFDRRRLMASPHDLETRLPLCLRRREDEDLG